MASRMLDFPLPMSPSTIVNLDFWMVVLISLRECKYLGVYSDISSYSVIGKLSIYCAVKTLLYFNSLSCYESI